MLLITYNSTSAPNKRNNIIDTADVVMLVTNSGCWVPRIWLMIRPVSAAVAVLLRSTSVGKHNVKLSFGQNFAFFCPVLCCAYHTCMYVLQLSNS
jgi:hypothetical protein